MAGELETGGGSELDNLDIGGAADEIASGLPDLMPDDGGEDLGDESAGDAPAAPAPVAKPPAGGKKPEPAVSLATPDPADQPPDTWRKEAKDVWSKLPPEAKAELRKREGDMATFVGQYRTMATVGQEIINRMQPLVPQYREAGIDPGKLVPGLIEAHRILAWGSPEEKVSMLYSMANGAGIDLKALATGGPEGRNAAQTQGAMLLQRINNIEQATHRSLTSENARQTAELESQVERFATAKTANGQAVHPYFDEVGPELIQLFRAGLVKTLDEAYEKAVQLNPITRQKEIDRITSERLAAKAKSDGVKVRQARVAAGVNVRSSGSGSRGAPAGGDWESDLGNILAGITGREGA